MHVHHVRLVDDAWTQALIRETERWKGLGLDAETRCRLLSLAVAFDGAQTLADLRQADQEGLRKALEDPAAFAFQVGGNPFTSRHTGHRFHACADLESDSAQREIKAAAQRVLAPETLRALGRAKTYLCLHK